MKNKKGFTLIELLVVIAIIGILAAIVLVSLRGAPAKAKNARIQSSLNQVRTQAEMIWVDKTTYCDATEPTFCLCSGTALNTTHATYGTELSALQADIGNQQGTLDLKCYASGDEYCISAGQVGSTDHFCLDDSGNVIKDATGECSAANTACSSL